MFRIPFGRLGNNDCVVYDAILGLTEAQTQEGGGVRGKITSVTKIRVSMRLGVAVKVRVALVTDPACH